MYYHLLIITDETREIYEFDQQSYNKIKEDVVKPFVLNKEFIVDGYFIEPSKVKRLLITRTSNTSDYYVQKEYGQLPKGLIIGISPEECVFANKDYVENITRKVLKEVKEQLTDYEVGLVQEENKGQASNKALGKTIFLAYSYRQEDEEFVDGFKELLLDKGFKVLDGKADRLGSISQAVLEKIRMCEIAVIVMNKRDKKENGKFTTSAWLLEEKGAALALDKEVAMFVEQEIDEADIGGLQGDDQRFHFTRNNFLKSVMNFIKIIEKNDK